MGHKNSKVIIRQVSHTSLNYVKAISFISFLGKSLTCNQKTIINPIN